MVFESWVLIRCEIASVDVLTGGTDGLVSCWVVLGASKCRDVGWKPLQVVQIFLPRQSSFICLYFKHPVTKF